MTVAPGGAAAPNSGSRAILYHDALADGWTQRYASGGFKRRADFFCRAGAPEGEGCGRLDRRGLRQRFFQPRSRGAGAEVLGIDGSAAMIAAARAFAGPGAIPRYEVGTVEDLSRQTGLFDGALFLSVMEYLDDPSASLGAIAGLLRPGGTLILSAPNRHSGLRRAQTSLRAFAAMFGSKAFPYLASSRNAWSRAELAALAAEQGLSCDFILGFDPVAPRALWSVVSPSLWFAVCRKRA